VTKWTNFSEHRSYQ